jgi:4-carboxymuconolactone decarboxylase
MNAQHRTDFGTWGRYTEIPVEKMTPDQKKAYEFALKNRGQVPGPYKIWLQNPKLIEVMVPLGAYYQGHSSLSKAEIEIVTNLTNGRWLAAYSNYEHEKIAEKDGGLPPEKVEALIAGLPTHFDDLRQQVVYEVTSTLIAPRVVPTGLYRRAVSLLGGCGSHGPDRTHWIFHLRVVEPHGLRRSIQCRWSAALKVVVCFMPR